MATTHLLYLHGFRSSPRSFKAQRMEAVVRERHPGVHWWCPQLPASPAAAMKLVRARGLPKSDKKRAALIKEARSQDVLQGYITHASVAWAN